MCSAMLTGLVISKFNSMLDAIPNLMIYMPLLMGTGGNSGSQASTVVIRGIAVGEIEPRDALKVLWKELRISALLGLSLSAINLVKILFLDGKSLAIGLTVCVAQVFVIILAKCLGGMLPLLAKKIGIDPALMAAPLISTLTDTFSCLIYFSLASMIFSNVF
jgi:magnesium transporter